MKSRKLLLILFFAVFLASCSLTNPLSELSWGTSTITGRVTRSYTVTGSSIPGIEGVPGALVKTDTGTENTYTNEKGFYSLLITFRIGSAAKEKKVTITAYDKNNQAKTASASAIVVRDGLEVQAPPITWAK